MTVYTTSEAAAKLQVTPRYLRKLLAVGKMRGQRKGRDWLISQAALDALAKRRKRRG